MTAVELESLSVARFGPFRACQAVPLHGSPGLVRITGKNEVEPELQGNGVGKTSLFDALTFTLYGQTADGSRGPDLVTWESEEPATLQLAFQLDRIPHLIERSIRPNSLTLKVGTGPAKPVEQHVIDSLLGYGKATFLAGTHHAQGLTTFLDLGPTAQLDLLSELLGLDIYARAADLASEGSKKEHEIIARQNETIARSRGEAIALEDEGDSLEDMQSEMMRQRYRFLKTCRREIDGWEKQLATERRKLEDIKDQIKAVDDTEIDRVKQVFEADAHEHARKSAESHILRTRRAQLATSIKESRVCPTCGRPFENGEAAENHAKTELKRIDGQLAAFSDELSELATTRDTANRRYLNLCNEINRSVEDMRKRQQELSGAIAGINATVSGLRQRQAELSKGADPFETRIAKTGQRLRDAEIDITRGLLKRRNALDREMKFDFWRKGFKDLRLSVVETALLHLTVHVNNALDRLGLPSWRLSVDAESLTKSGNVRRGMKISVIIDEHERPVARLSFGERQRLRIAVSLGMADMIENVTGTVWSAEFLDEPTSWLSPSGVNALLALLAERASLRQRRIFLADHRVYQYAFTETLMITKSLDGARVEMMR